MKNSVHISVPSPFDSVDEVLAGLYRLESAFVAGGDQRGVFTTAYVVTTTKLKNWIDDRRFLQNDLVARYVVAFGNEYRAALAADETGVPSAVPGAWRQSFTACLSNQTSIFQNLILGINAHINHDLAHAVIRAGLNVHCPSCYADHTRMNDALRLATPIVRQRVAANYNRWLNVANWLCGRAIDQAVGKCFEQARETAWTWAKALAASQTDTERGRVTRMIDSHAVSVGADILRYRGTPVRAMELLARNKSEAAAPRLPVISPAPLANLCAVSVS